MRLLPILLSLLITGSASANPMVSVSAGTELRTFFLDESTHTLTDIETIEVAAAGVQAISPDATHLYLGTTVPSEEGNSAPSIASYAITENGKLSLLANEISSISPGYLSADATGKFLAGNNYRDGTVTIWNLADDSTYAGHPARTMELEEKAHCAKFAHNNDFLFVPATGPNKIFQLAFNESTGAIHPAQPSAAPGPQGENDARHPRHLVFHPTLPIAYSTLESKHPGVAVWSYDPENGNLNLIENQLSVDIKDSEGMSTADLHLTPDGRFLYVSNRDGMNKKNPTGRDSIALFETHVTSGTLAFIKRFPTQKIPRSFTLSPSGKTMIVGGQGDNTLGVYAIDPSNGHLSLQSTTLLNASIRWVSCFETPESDR